MGDRPVALLRLQQSPSLEWSRMVAGRHIPKLPPHFHRDDRTAAWLCCWAGWRHPAHGEWTYDRDVATTAARDLPSVDQHGLQYRWMDGWVGRHIPLGWHKL